MGNLEKLGILVIVILVVVVGVVAITPSETIFPPDTPALPPLTAEADEPLPPLDWPIVDPVAEPLDPSPHDDERLGGSTAGEPTEEPTDEPLPTHRSAAGTDRPAPVPPLTPPRIQPGGPGAQPAVDPRRIEPVRPLPAPAPARTTHTVKSGESLYRIAERHLGNGDRWREIAKVNPGINADRLKVGQVIELPPKVLGRIIRPAPQPPAAAVPAPGTKTLTRRASTYRVKKGDTLSGIAAKRLGSAGQWRRLLEANADALSSPEALQVGMVLRIPASGASDTGSNARRPAPTSRPAETYTVVRGDTLSKIAARKLGSAGAWWRLLEANRDVIQDPERLHVGTKLKIPERRP